MSPANAEQRQQLVDVRHVLLRLHKALLDAQRSHYERTHGPVTSAGQFLQVVISDPTFDWLHRFSELIVEIDEATDGREPLSQSHAAALLQQTRALVHNADIQRYEQTLQSDAHASMLHQELTQLLHRA